MAVIDCAQKQFEVALFGPPNGYAGAENGSQLNNHLAAHSGERNLVFLDEFDKTDRAVHNALLLLLDSGEYHDRRKNNVVDASKTIWIMATNLGDQAITRFHRNHLQGVDDKTKAPYARLIDTLKSTFNISFGAPMAGRMRNIAPFFPFNEDERAVVAHKFLMELVSEVREPIDTTAPALWFPGHVHLNIKNDDKLSAHIATESYVEQLGARSVQSGIDDVRNAFFAAYTNTNELVENAMNDGALMKFTAQLLPVRGDDSEDVVNKVSVAADGYSEYYCGQGNGDEMDVDELAEEFDKGME